MNQSFEAKHRRSPDGRFADMEHSRLARIADVTESFDWGSCNHRGQNLDDIDLSDGYLIDNDFSDCTMYHATLRGVKAEGADFRRVDMTEGRLEGSNLERTRFGDANCTNVSFYATHLRDSDFSGNGSTFVNADFTEADMRGVKLDGADMRKANFTHADLRGATGFEEANFPDAIWDSTDLRDTEVQPESFEWMQQSKQIANDWDKTITPIHEVRLGDSNENGYESVYSRGSDGSVRATLINPDGRNIRVQGTWKPSSDYGHRPDLFDRRAWRRSISEQLDKIADEYHIAVNDDAHDNTLHILDGFVDDQGRWKNAGIDAQPDTISHDSLARLLNSTDSN